MTHILSFSSFPNLTHLFLRNSCHPECLWWDSQSVAVTSLHLEELFIWSRSNFESLSRKLSGGMPICRTLCRLSFQDHNLDHNWVEHCPYLSHILVLFSSYKYLSRFLRAPAPSFSQLQCYIIGPTWDTHHVPPGEPKLKISGDRRIAFVLRRLSHLFQTYGDSFWSGQNRMWKKAERHIAKNPHPQSPTIIDSVSI
ncbi:hypothetical protein DL96DRAFT_1627297 [Flagelloscypha sp. PMI_526]|nr:hypothetical protein DL96DRAFT_1627297 [Flagelloscypha sp. PMI_526]